MVVPLTAAEPEPEPEPASVSAPEPVPASVPEPDPGPAPGGSSESQSAPFAISALAAAGPSPTPALRTGTARSNTDSRRFFAAYGSSGTSGTAAARPITPTIRSGFTPLRSKILRAAAARSYDRSQLVLPRLANGRASVWPWISICCRRDASTGASTARNSCSGWFSSDDAESNSSSSPSSLISINRPSGVAWTWTLPASSARPVWLSTRVSIDACTEAASSPMLLSGRGGVGERSMIDGT